MTPGGDRLEYHAIVTARVRFFDWGNHGHHIYDIVPYHSEVTRLEHSNDTPAIYASELPCLVFGERDTINSSQLSCRFYQLRLRTANFF